MALFAVVCGASPRLRCMQTPMDGCASLLHAGARPSKRDDNFGDRSIVHGAKAASPRKRSLRRSAEHAPSGARQDLIDEAEALPKRSDPRRPRGLDQLQRERRQKEKLVLGHGGRSDVPLTRADRGASRMPPTPRCREICRSPAPTLHSAACIWLAADNSRWPRRGTSASHPRDQHDGTLDLPPTEAEKHRRRDWLHALRLEPAPTEVHRPATRSTSSASVDTVEDARAREREVQAAALWRDLQFRMAGNASLCVEQLPCRHVRRSATLVVLWRPPTRFAHVSHLANARRSARPVRAGRAAAAAPGCRAEPVDWRRAGPRHAGSARLLRPGGSGLRRLEQPTARRPRTCTSRRSSATAPSSSRPSGSLAALRTHPLLIFSTGFRLLRTCRSTA